MQVVRMMRMRLGYAAQSGRVNGKSLTNRRNSRRVARGCGYARGGRRRHRLAPVGRRRVGRQHRQRGRNRCVASSPVLASRGPPIVWLDFRVSSCPGRSPASTRAPVSRGAGSGCSRRQSRRATGARATGGGATCTRSRCNARSSGRCARRVSPNRRPRTRCGTHSRPTCSSPAKTSAPCGSFSAIAPCRRR